MTTVATTTSRSSSPTSCRHSLTSRGRSSRPKSYWTRYLGLRRRRPAQRSDSNLKSRPLHPQNNSVGHELHPCRFQAEPDRRANARNSLARESDQETTVLEIPPESAETSRSQGASRPCGSWNGYG